MDLTSGSDQPHAQNKALSPSHTGDENTPFIRLKMRKANEVIKEVTENLHPEPSTINYSLIHNYH